MNEQRPEKEDKNWGLIAACWGLAVLVVFVALSAFQYWLISGCDVKADWFSASGDFFGFANAVFSALAFAMIIVTLWMQKHELELQRQEIRDNRHVLENQQNEMAQQNASLARSNFEGLFFSLLSKQKEITDDIRSPYGTRGEIKHNAGALAIRDLVDEMRKSMAKLGISDEIQLHCAQWFNEKPVAFGRYFRNLAVILDLIGSVELKQQKLYVGILKAQMSVFEFELVFWYGLYSDDSKNLRPQLERLSFFEGLKLPKVEDSHKKIYHFSAFGESECSV